MAVLLLPGVSASEPVSWSDSAAYQLGGPAVGRGESQAARGARSEARNDNPPSPSASPTTEAALAGSGEAPEPVDALPDLGAVPVDFTPPSAEAVLASGFVRPVAGVPSSPFGLRLHPIQHVWKLHSGQDLAAPCGTPVVAVQDATVTFVGTMGGYGGRIVLDHGGGLATTYNHLSAYAAVPGLVVHQGQVIGFVGTTGMSTGCHLHFEVKIQGAFVDPAPYLGMAPAPPVVIPPAVTPTGVGADTPTGPAPATATSSSTGSSSTTASMTTPPTTTPPTTTPPASTPPASTPVTTPAPTHPTPPATPSTAPTTSAGPSSPSTGGCPTSDPGASTAGRSATSGGCAGTATTTATAPSSTP
jgi:hypothetical protein